MLQPTENERRDIVRAVFGDGLANDANTSRFKAFFDHYCSIVCPASLGNVVIELETPALGSHADILSCIEIIVQNPKISFNGFATTILGSKSTESSLREKEHLAKVTVQVAFGINCTLRDYYADGFMNGRSHHAKWEGDVSFLHFMESAFNLESHGIQAPEQQLRYREMITRKTSLKAWKLTKRYGIKIKGTENLLEHLVLDLETRTLKVFHQLSFLRAHLTKSKGHPMDMNFEDSLRR